jgi:DNA-directed RNA polymerase specialized sigma24 family protein
VQFHTVKKPRMPQTQGWRQPVIADHFGITFGAIEKHVPKALGHLSHALDADGRRP